MDPDFHERAVQAVAAAVARAAGEFRPVSHVSAGEADVDRVACSRRVVGPDGKVRFNRYSFTKDPGIRQAAAGEIDPKLKSVGLWDGERALAVLSYYAVHPMSRYGGGAVSADFPGLARARRQAQTPGTLQVYLTGCSGDLTAASWNEGDEASKSALAERLRDAMERATASARREPLSGLGFRAAKAGFRIPSEGPASVAAMRRTLADAKASKSDRLMAALGLSWAERLERGEAVDVPCLDLGRASLLVLPAEAFVSFQLAAQRMRPGRFVAAAGYGECGPGYLPTEAARAEGFVEEHGYCWTAPGAEAALLRAIDEALPGRASPGADPAGHRAR